VDQLVDSQQGNKVRPTHLRACDGEAQADRARWTTSWLEPRRVCFQSSRSGSWSKTPRIPTE
jgi:hypothetical protein